MIPFLSSTGTSDHEIRNDVEEAGETETLVGGADGTRIELQMLKNVN